jgi:hypothetical protein
MLFRDGAEIDVIAAPASVDEFAVTSFEEDLPKRCEELVDGAGHAR